MKIVLATGGTGGHIHPALEVAEELKGQGHQVIFAGSLGGSADKINKRGFDAKDFPSQGLVSHNVLRFFSFLFIMLQALVKSMKFVKDYRPDAVLGFGGYGSFPVILASRLLNVPAMVHEQNVVPGRANKLLAVFVNKIAISFKGTEKYFSTRKVVLTGCPTHLKIRSLDRAEILKTFGLEQGVFTILIAGGSQGSRRVNSFFLESAKQLKDKMDFQVVHLAGSKDCDDLKEKYRALCIKAAVFTFLENMDQAYFAADLVIARSGALTVTELGLFQKLSILIPYPYAQGHQRNNAFVLQDAGISRVIEEKDLTSGLLIEKILEMRSLQLSREDIGRRTEGFIIKDAAKRLVKEVVSLIK